MYSMLSVKYHLFVIISNISKSQTKIVSYLVFVFYFIQRGATGHGSFENWSVLLLTESRREDGFKRLLEAGGATVLSNKSVQQSL